MNEINVEIADVAFDEKSSSVSYTLSVSGTTYAAQKLCLTHDQIAEYKAWFAKFGTDSTEPLLRANEAVVSALPDDTPQPKGSESWPQDALHGKIKDVLGDMKKVVPAARQALRQGIDVADAGPVGRERSDQALGRALRFGK